MERQDRRFAALLVFGGIALMPFPDAGRMVPIPQEDVAHSLFVESHAQFAAQIALVSIPLLIASGE